MNRLLHFIRERLARISGSLRRRDFERDTDEEFAIHLSLLTERFIARGLSPEEARYAARRQFGGETQVKIAVRDHGRFQPLENLFQDISYCLRQLRKSPLFALAAMLTLALGIGANTAIFTLVDQLILRLLPVKDPQSIVLLIGKGEYYGSNMGLNALSYPMYQTIRDRDQVFSNMMCRRSMPMVAAIQNQGQVLSGELVSGNYFPLLGIQPAAGRLFDANDDLRSGSGPVAVLSYAYWQNRFTGDWRVIGSRIAVNNYPLTIIGVAQAGFTGLEPGLPTQIFVPVTMTPQVFPNMDFARMFDSRLRWLNVYGRLKPGVTRERAKAALQPVFHQILEREVLEPAFGRATPYIRAHFLRMWMDVLPGGQGNQELRHQYQKPLALLMGVTGFVLLISSANLASLLAARAASRQREVAIRLAIGSSRGRIIRQLLTESLLLALTGGLAGLVLAVGMVKGLVAFLPQNPAGYSISHSPDWQMLSFAFGLSLSTGLLFGLVPALQAAYPNITETLKATASNVSGGSGQILFRKLLVAVQITLSLLLLAGAGLFIRSLRNLRAVDPGFETRSLVQFDIDLSPAGYDQLRARAFFETLRTRLLALPGVEAVGYADNAVLAGNDWESGITVAGHESKPGEDRNAHINRVDGGYFEALGIRLLSGRVFKQGDTVDTPKAAVVNESFARHYFGDRPAIGHRIGRGADPHTPTDMEIVGVVNDTRYEDLIQKAPRQVYLCAGQGRPFGHTVYVKEKGNVQTVLSSARRVVRDMEPRTPLMNVKTVEQQIDESLATERMIASLSMGFSLLATALSVLGLYGVMAYMVTQRAREIGIRVALGALFGNVIWLIMREVVVVVVTGIAISVPLVLALARFVQSELFGIQATDPATIVFAVLLLSAIAVAAGFIPARRAATSDPLTVLRYE
jgi:predicted permease